jgi:hypothetical protein
MDVPAIEIAAPAREVLRDHRGTIIGTLEPQSPTGKVVAHSPRGVVVGVYDPRSNETRDARGRVIKRGNLLGALLLRGL